jgi:hypothetical protein
MQWHNEDLGVDPVSSTIISKYNKGWVSQ